MPRYRANAKFGPWLPGEEFESTDPFHAMLAEQGRLLTETEQYPSAMAPPLIQRSQTPLTPDMSPPRQPVRVEEDDDEES